MISAEGKSLIDELYQENEEIGVSISNDFYKTYKAIRNNLYARLKELNQIRMQLCYSQNSKN